MANVNYKKAWEDKYEYLVQRRKGIPWETSGPSLDLAEFIETADMGPGSKVLDVGCGTGIDAIYLASRGFEVTGIDISPTAISLANKKARGMSNCKFLVADIFQLDFNENTFDLVCDRGCFHNIMHSKESFYIENTKRVLKEGGLFLLSCLSTSNRTSHWEQIWVQIKRFFKNPKSCIARERSNQTFYSEESIRETFSQDFEILRISEMQLPLARALREDRFFITCLMKNTYIK